MVLLFCMDILSGYVIIVYVDVKDEKNEVVQLESGQVCCLTCRLLL